LKTPAGRGKVVAPNGSLASHCSFYSIFHIQACTMTDLLTYKFLVSIKMQTTKLACWISINDYLFVFALLDYNFEIDFNQMNLLRRLCHGCWE
jgi:hypothetical protein